MGQFYHPYPKGPPIRSQTSSWFCELGLGVGLGVGGGIGVATALMVARVVIAPMATVVTAVEKEEEEKGRNMKMWRWGGKMNIWRRRRRRRRCRRMKRRLLYGVCLCQMGSVIGFPLPQPAIPPYSNSLSSSLWDLIHQSLLICQIGGWGRYPWFVRWACNAYWLVILYPDFFLHWNLRSAKVRKCVTFHWLLWERVVLYSNLICHWLLFPSAVWPLAQFLDTVAFRRNRAARCMKKSWPHWIMRVF